MEEQVAILFWVVRVRLGKAASEQRLQMHGRVSLVGVRRRNMPDWEIRGEGGRKSLCKGPEEGCAWNDREGLHNSLLVPRRNQAFPFPLW